MINWARNTLYGIILLPVALAFFYALKFSFGYMDMTAIDRGGSHWIELLNSNAFWSSLTYSLLIAVLSLIIGLFFAAMLSYREYQITLRRPSLIFYLGLIFPPVVAGFLGVQWLGQSGWLSRLLYHFGWIEHASEFPEWVYGHQPWALIFVHGLLITPFFTLLFYDLYHRVHLRKMMHMSQNFGIHRGHFWRYALGPLLFRKTFPLWILYIVLIMGSYEIPLVMGGIHPKMLSVFIVDKLQKFDLNGMPQAYAAAVLYFLIAILIIGFAARSIQQTKIRAL